MDFCARLPYGVKGIVVHYDDVTRESIDVIGEIKGITNQHKLEFHYLDGTYGFNRFPIEDFKPYLRPMSSMTKEEEKEFNKQIYKAKPYSDGKSYNVYEVTGLNIDWLNAHHFDYRGLIEKGLAIEATKAFASFFNIDNKEEKQ